MSWSFSMYGIDAAKFEAACFHLLLKHGFSMDRCTQYSTLFQRDDRLQSWHQFHGELRPHVNGDWSAVDAVLGIEEMGGFGWNQNKNTCFALNKITLWYLNRFSHLSPSPIVPYENGCFLADKATNDAIVDWVTTALAFVEMQYNVDFVWDHWDVEYNEGLLPAVRDYFGESGWKSSEYQYAFQHFYHPIRGLLSANHDWFYWAHSY